MISSLLHVSDAAWLTRLDDTTVPAPAPGVNDGLPEDGNSYLLEKLRACDQSSSELQATSTPVASNRPKVVPSRPAKRAIEAVAYSYGDESVPVTKRQRFEPRCHLCKSDATRISAVYRPSAGRARSEQRTGADTRAEEVAVQRLASSSGESPTGSRKKEATSLATTSATRWEAAASFAQGAAWIQDKGTESSGQDTYLRRWWRLRHQGFCATVKSR